MKDDELEGIGARLAEKHYSLKKEWLKVCVEFLENTLGKKTPEELLCLIIHQFLMSRISDSYEPVMKIPKAAVKIVIVKRIIFQVLSYTNISISLYEQLTEATKNNDDLSWFHGNFDENSQEHEEKQERESNFLDEKNGRNSKFSAAAKKKRMLKLVLTDGNIDLKGVELEEIFDEKLLVPGSKIMLTGKVKCRRGVLLLEKSNCQFLGGRVESIDKIDKIKQLSDALKIDLDAEKRRKKKPVESAPKSVKKTLNSSKKCEKSANQSTISPFLVKTDRKTGQVKNPTKCAKNSSVSIEEEKEREVPPAQTPTPEPPAREEFDPICANFAWDPNNNDSIDGKKLENPSKTSKNNSQKNMEDSTLISSSSFENFENAPENKKISVNLEKIGKRQLPEQLLRDVEIDEIVNNSIEEAPPENKKRDEKIDKKKEWDWDRKGSEEEEVATKKWKRADSESQSVMILPPCLFDKQRKERSLSDESAPKPPNIFAKTIHGPRFDGTEFPENRLEKLEKKGTIAPKITDHYRSVKGLPSGLPHPIKSAMKKISPLIPIEKPVVSEIEENFQRIEEEEEEEEEQEEEHMIVQSILSTIRRTSNLMDSPTPPTFSEPKRVENAPNRVEIEETAEKSDDSILECTIEQEGRMELQKWGLSSEKWAEPELKDDVIGKRTVIDYANAPIQFQSINYADEQTAHSTQVPSSASYFHASSAIAAQNWHHSLAPPPQAPPTFVAPPLPPTKRIKIESAGETSSTIRNQGETMMMRMRRAGKKESRDEEIKNKQSDNVQIYKTPFAKRIPSSDAAASCTSELFQRLAALHIVPLGDALLNRKFWMMSKIVVVMPTICHQVHELKSDGIDWQLQMRVSDTSVSDVVCLVATPLLNRIFGFSVQQCKSLFNAKQFNELRVKKAEAERKLVGFKRLDLLVWIEISPESEKFPLILDVKTVSDALNIL